MVNLLSAIILGIVQGVTEWLPISSSGHLVIFEQFFNLKADIFFNLMLHFATLLVVCFVFRRELLDVIKAVIKLDFRGENGKLFLFIVIGSVPIAFAGFFSEAFITSLFSNLFTVGMALVLTGILVYSSRFSYKLSALDYKRSFFIGIFQALALMPGISRSGATISSALISGVERQRAIRFSFLLSIPAILGATIFLISKTTISALETPALIVGMLTSIIVGYISLKTLIKIVLEKKFYLFSFYCWILGIIVIYLSLFL